MSKDSVNNPPLVSVLMPAYNAAAFLDLTIESVLNQKFSDFELLIIDDCSQDNTFEIANKWVLVDDRIQIIRNSSNLGIAGNRNKAVSLARGKYIAWQDADDISFPDRLALQSAYLELNPDVGIVGGSMEIFSENQILGYRHYPQTDDLIRRAIFRYSPIAQPTAMILADALHKVGAYDLSLPPAEDLDMTFRIGEHYLLSNLSNTLIRYRVSETSATAVAQRRMELNTLRIRFKFSKSSAYEIGINGVLFNVIHLISLWTVPAAMKRWLFSKLRDTKQ
jgi:glycosyltransferase involved in cell wall biosynthesis